MGKNVKPKVESNFQSIISRIDSLRGSRSVSAFARFLGLPQKSLDNYLKQGRKPSVELIVLVCTKCQVSSDWLLGLTPNMQRGGVRDPATNAGQSATSDPELQALRRDLAALVQRVEALGSRRG